MSATHWHELPPRRHIDGTAKECAWCGAEFSPENPSDICGDSLVCRDDHACDARAAERIADLQESAEVSCVP